MENSTIRLAGMDNMTYLEIDPAFIASLEESGDGSRITYYSGPNVNEFYLKYPPLRVSSDIAMKRDQHFTPIQ